MAEMTVYVRYFPVFLCAAALSACSSNMIESKVILAVAKTASIINPPVKDKKIMSPAEVSLMIKSLKADVANSKKIAGTTKAVSVKVAGE